MTGPRDDDLFDLREPTATDDVTAGRRSRIVVAALVVALVVAVLGATLLLRHDGPTPDAAARTAAGSPSAVSAPASLAPTTGPADVTTGSPSHDAEPTVVPTPAAPDPVKDTSTPMPPAERAAAETELRAFVAAHLTAPVSLTSPIEWAGADPDRPAPGGMATCPHLADRLGTQLGGRWTYTFGSLPNYGGCSWTPVPWVPEADPTLRYFESVGFAPGVDVASADAHLRYQAAGTQCPEVDAPAVAPGAFAVRCQDPDDLTYELVVPDAAGRGLWSLRTYAGHAQTGHTAQEGLVALVAAAQAAY
jgi:hypothetical protein